MKRNERLSILNEQINITLKELEFTDNYKLDVMLMKLKNEKKKLIRELSKEYIDNDTLLLYDDNMKSISLVTLNKILSELRFRNNGDIIDDMITRFNSIERNTYYELDRIYKYIQMDSSRNYTMGINREEYTRRYREYSAIRMNLSNMSNYRKVIISDKEVLLIDKYFSERYNVFRKINDYMNDNIRKTGYCNGRDGVKYYEYRIDE